MNADLSAHYDAKFFDAISPGSARSAAKIVPFITSLTKPTSVVDVGCGTGAWIAEFNRCGIQDAMGIDGPHIDKSRLLFPSELFRSVDLEKRIRVGRSFDLAISMEVAEHLAPGRASSLVRDLADLAPIILFSAAAPIPGQGGRNHINEQWPSYWSTLFRRCEFMPIDLRGRFWDDTDIEWWYRQNMLLFVRKDSLGRFAHASQPPLDIVHPAHPIYAAYRQPTLGFLFRSLPGAVARFFRARVLAKLGG
jgi:SAM-dependent methyltransferase